MTVKGASLAAALLAAGCAEVLDLDRFQGSPAQAAGSGGSDGTCVCTEEAPAGWSGPGVLYLDGADAPACPESWPMPAVLGGTNPSAAPASCLPCACTNATGVCGATALIRYGVSGCSGSSTLFSTSFACSAMPSSTIVASVTATLPLEQTGGSCQALGGGVQSAPPSIFEENALLCAGATPTANCGAGSLCVPRPTAPFTQQLCIWRTGDVACESPYLERTLIHGGSTDMRSCSPCGCGDPSEVTIQCTGHVELYKDGMCTELVANAPADGQTCTDIGGIGSTLYVTDSERGTCPPFGGDPIGEVTPANPTTICCHSM